MSEDGEKEEMLDRGPLFIKRVKSSLFFLLGIRAKMCSTHYPQTDGLLKRLMCPKEIRMMLVSLENNITL
jgi:hypothetical protein